MLLLVLALDSMAQKTNEFKIIKIKFPNNKCKCLFSDSSKTKKIEIDDVNEMTKKFKKFEIKLSASKYQLPENEISLYRCDQCFLVFRTSILLGSHLKKKH